ncbi:hypothetical protein CsSME_00020505 [Camellia sinensis var. sinensis]
MDRTGPSSSSPPDNLQASSTGNGEVPQGSCSDGEVLS